MATELPDQTRQWRMALILVLALAVATFVALGLSAYAVIEAGHEADRRIAANHEALVNGCEHRNTIVVELGHLIDIATNGIPPGASSAIDQLRIERHNLHPEDCQHISTLP